MSNPRPPITFRPPRVRMASRGIRAFREYDWYFKWIKRYLNEVREVFLVPCAATKPIHTSPLHKSVYIKYYERYGGGKELLVVSEPVVLIRYEDLYTLESDFCYDFPPKLLSAESRQLFVSRLRELLEDREIAGCLPSHHARLINDAIGTNWKNHWKGDLYKMKAKAARL